MEGVRLTVFPDQLLAELAVNELRRAGIVAQVHPAPGEFEVLVLPDHLERARLVVPPPEIPGDDGAFSDWSEDGRDPVVGAPAAPRILPASPRDPIAPGPARARPASTLIGAGVLVAGLALFLVTHEGVGGLVAAGIVIAGVALLGVAAIRSGRR